MANDLNFKTLVSTPTGVGASTGRQTEVAFNENFEIVKDNLLTIYGIISSSVLSEDLTMLKIDKTSSPWIVYYTSDPVDTPEQQVNWYPINRTTFASLLGEPYENSALNSALGLKANASDVTSLSAQLAGALQSITNNTQAIAGNTQAIGVNSAAINSIRDELLSVVHTIAGSTLYLKYDSTNQLVYISEDGEHWIDMNGLRVTWDSITGNVADNTSLVSYINNQLAGLSSVYATLTDLSDHTTDYNNPHSVTKAQVGLGAVDNTSDLDKPISNAVQDALYNITSNMPPVYTMSASEYQADPPQDNSIYFTSVTFTTNEGE